MRKAQKFGEKGGIGAAHLPADQLIMALYSLLQPCIGGSGVEQRFDEGEAVAPAEFDEFGFADGPLCGLNRAMNHKIREGPALKIGGLLT